MPDASVAQRRIALGLAGAALVIASVAVVVVIRRGDGATDRAVTGLEDHDVAAAELLRLHEWGAVAPAGEGKPGVRVKDAALAHTLGLEPDDVITELSGRPVARDFDVYLAISGAGTGDQHTLYAELARGTLVRWHVKGELHADRQAPSTATAGVLGGVVGGSPSLAPSIDPDDDDLADSIDKIDDTHATIPRATVDKILANPMGVAKGARVVPAIQNGKPHGFKLYAIRPSSLFSKLGFLNGDTIVAVNGYEITSPDKALEVYTKLRSVDQLTFDIERRGQPTMLTVTIR
jgi:S1-C subfamily serine protease